MRKLVALAAVLVAMMVLAACTARPSNPRPKVDVDLTGADIAIWDSLAKGDYSGPILDTMPLMPIPIPARMRRTKVSAVFTLNERGAITRLSITPVVDAAYGRKLVTTLLTFAFRPARKADDTLTVGHYRFTYEF